MRSVRLNVARLLAPRFASLSHPPPRPSALFGLPSPGRTLIAWRQRLPRIMRAERFHWIIPHVHNTQQPSRRRLMVPTTQQETGSEKNPASDENKAPVIVSQASSGRYSPHQSHRCHHRLKRMPLNTMHRYCTKPRDPGSIIPFQQFLACGTVARRHLIDLFKTENSKLRATRGVEKTRAFPAWCPLHSESHNTEASMNPPKCLRPSTTCPRNQPIRAGLVIPRSQKADHHTKYSLRCQP